MVECNIEAVLVVSSNLTLSTINLGEVNWFNNMGYAIYKNKLVKSIPNKKKINNNNIIILLLYYNNRYAEIGRQISFRPKWFKYRASSSLAIYMFNVFYNIIKKFLFL